jgi:hypothetical protein
MAQEKVIEAESVAPKTESKSDWLKKVDESSVGDLRRRFPKAFWIVGGVVLVALIF